MYFSIISLTYYLHDIQVADILGRQIQNKMGDDERVEGLITYQEKKTERAEKHFILASMHRVV